LGEFLRFSVAQTVHRQVLAMPYDPFFRVLAQKTQRAQIFFQAPEPPSEEIRNTVSGSVVLGVLRVFCIKAKLNGS
jgi:hypothetical protein